MPVLKKQYIPPSPNKILSTLDIDNVVFSVNEIIILRSTWDILGKDELLEHKRGLNSSQATASAFFCQQFYDNLLREHPQLQSLFPSLQDQSAAMAGVLTFVISKLEDVSQFRGILIKLAKLHSRLMAIDVCHYEYVGNALLQTIGDRRGGRFTFEEEHAWIKLYSFIANTMLKYGKDPIVE